MRQDKPLPATDRNWTDGCVQRFGKVFGRYETNVFIAAGLIVIGVWVFAEIVEAVLEKEPISLDEKIFSKMKGDTMDLIRILFSILLPPLGVFFQVGLGKHFWLNILLTLLGYIPGIVHAVWVIAKYR